MSNLPAILISDIEIRQDAEGRFCLNDLHKASGGAQKHRPNYWLNLQQTVELIAELSDAGVPASLRPIAVIKGGDSRQPQGTFVVKELVYSYAMWVSPKFHLHVIRTFDALVNKPVVYFDPTVQAMANLSTMFLKELDAVKSQQAKLTHAVKSEIKKRKALQTDVATLKSKLAQLDTASNFFTILAYAKYAWGYDDNRLPLEKANKMGRIVAKYCREHGIDIGSVPDGRFGKTNTYPLDILERLFPLPKYINETPAERAERLNLQTRSRH